MRTFKIIRNGRTTSAATHDFEEAAQALAATQRPEAPNLRPHQFDIRYQGPDGRERPLTARERTDLILRAAQLAVQREGSVSR